VIGHEMVHAFDDVWWQPEDISNFKALVAKTQYSRYEPLPGLHPWTGTSL
jgi:predicted metalloendopeptidase